MPNVELTSLFSIGLDIPTGIKPAYHVKLMLFCLIITYETIILIILNCFFMFGQSYLNITLNLILYSEKMSCPKIMIFGMHIHWVLMSICSKNHIFKSFAHLKISK